MKKVENGIEKEVDSLGRVVIPKNFRVRLGIDCGSKVLFSMDGDAVRIKSAECVCAICGGREKIKSDLGMCHSCIEKVKEYGE